MRTWYGQQVRSGLTIRRWEPAGLERVQVRAAHAAVRNLNVDVVLCPLLGLEGAPLHLAIDGLRILAEPALKLWCGHNELRGLVLDGGRRDTDSRIESNSVGEGGKVLEQVYCGLSRHRRTRERVVWLFMLSDFALPSRVARRRQIKTDLAPSLSMTHSSPRTWAPLAPTAQTKERPLLGPAQPRSRGYSGGRRQGRTYSKRPLRPPTGRRLDHRPNVEFKFRARIDLAGLSEALHPGGHLVANPHTRYHQTEGPPEPLRLPQKKGGKVQTSTP